MKNYFILFNLPIIFNIDLNFLEESYINLQNKIHPDRFLFSNNENKHYSLKYSTYINKAYTVLKDPLQRSIYLCKLYKFNLHIGENKIIFSKKILFEQLKLYEFLGLIKTIKNNIISLKLEKRIFKKIKIVIEKINKQFLNNNLEKVKNLIYKLIFLEKFKKDINN